MIASQCAEQQPRSGTNSNPFGGLSAAVVADNSTQQSTEGGIAKRFTGKHLRPGGQTGGERNEEQDDFLHGRVLFGVLDVW